MKKILPAVLILAGVAEIIIAVMDVKLPIIIAMVLGIIFIASGVKALADARKKK